MNVGIDLGGTGIKAAIVDDNGSIIKRAEVPTCTKDGTEAVVNNIIRSCADVLDGTDIRPWSIGIGVPGIVDDAAGKVLYTANLPLRNTDITSHLEKEYNCPVCLGNDANCAVLGEAVAGSAKGAKSAAIITLGTGIGGGIIIDGNLVTGVSGAAGEIGHAVICHGGRSCGCGKHGCFETYASATGLIRTAYEVMDEHPESLLWKLCGDDKEKLEGKTVFDAYKANDAAAALVINTYVEHLAAGIANLINTIEPEIICIGGGISNAWDSLEEPLNKAVNKEKFTRFAQDLPTTKLVRATLGNDAGIIGAAMLGRQA